MPSPDIDESIVWMPDMTRVSAAAEAAVFQYMVGGALANWAHLEHLLGVLAQQVVSSDGMGFIAGFEAIPGFTGKIEFVNSAISRHPDYERVKGRWTHLRDRLKAAASRRNQLAHQMHAHMVSGDEGCRIRLVSFKMGDGDFDKRQGRGINHAMQARHEFDMIAKAIFRFHILLEHQKDISFEEPKPKISLAAALEELKGQLADEASDAPPSFPRIGFAKD